MWLERTVVVKFYISLTLNIYLISLKFFETGKLPLANGIGATHKKQLNISSVLHLPIPISLLFVLILGVVSIVQLVEVTDSAV